MSEIGYRLKEKLPSNLLEYRALLGVPEVIREGEDITIVSWIGTAYYPGSAVLNSVALVANCDVQTLLPLTWIMRYPAIIEENQPHCICR